MHAVQPLDVFVEVRLERLQSLRFAFPDSLIDLAARVPGPLELLEDIGLAGLAGMQLQAELAQADLAQAAMHHVQRRRLLRHEQHPASLGQTLRDEIGNRLALARTRRADQHEVLALAGGHDRRQLRRIGWQRAEDLRRTVFMVQPPGVRERNIRHERIARRVKQMADHGVGVQLLGSLGQILPHQVLGERELRQHHLGADLPAPDVLDSGGHAIPHRLDIQTRFIPRKVVLVDLQGQAEILVQHLGERRVEARLVVEQAQRKMRPHALPLQLHRQQQQRRLVARGRLVVRMPVQEAQRQEQRVGTALLQRRPRRPIQLDQPGLHLLLGQVDEHLAPLQHLLGMAAAQILQRAPLMHGLAATIGACHQVGARQQADRGATGQQILQGRGLGSLHLHGPRAHPEIQQVVAQRQVQQLALPMLEPVLGCLRLAILGHLVLHGQVRRGHREGIGGRSSGVAGHAERRGGHSHSMGTRQRPDALQARAPHVHGQFEWRLGQCRLLEMARAVFHRHLERGCWPV